MPAVEKITICVGIKGREEQFLNCLIASMNECPQKSRLSLSVFDCGTPGLKFKIHSVWGEDFIYSHKEMQFARTYSLNGAADAASSQYLFFTDVDITLPEDFVDQFDQNVAPGKVWFPICFSLNENAPRVVSRGNGYWRATGYGMCGFYKPDFLKIGRWNQRFMIYGAEDNDIYDRCCKEFEVVRKNSNGLFHNWHPVKKFGID